MYQNGKLPLRGLMPSYAKPSPPKFTLTNSEGMALGLRPSIGCDAAAEDLTIETQMSDPQNPRQQFEITQDGQIVSVRCPNKVLTTVLGRDGVCNERIGLQIREYGHVFKQAEIRYVKVSLPGQKRTLSLSEVQVFSVVNGVETNIALASAGATAKQSSTYSDFSASIKLWMDETKEINTILHIQTKKQILGGRLICSSHMKSLPESLSGTEVMVVKTVYQEQSITARCQQECGESIFFG